MNDKSKKTIQHHIIFTIQDMLFWGCKQKFVLWLGVCMGLGFTVEPQPNPVWGPGLGLVAEILFSSVPNWDLVKMIAIKHYIDQFGHYQASLFSQRNFTSSCGNFMLVMQSGSLCKSYWLDFLGDFCSCAIQEIFQDNISLTCHPICLYHSTNTNIISDFLSVLLNNSFKDYWHLCIKRKNY
jgi:hypothetical protein